MSKEADDLRILRLHKKWADRYTLLWQFFIPLLFAGVYWLLEQFGVGAAQRASALVFLAAMVLAATIWQAAGLSVARIHMLLENTDLDVRPSRNG